jgi:peptidoglycan hydrolase-like amidase
VKTSQLEEHRVALVQQESEARQSGDSGRIRAIQAERQRIEETIEQKKIESDKTTVSERKIETSLQQVEISRLEEHRVALVQQEHEARQHGDFERIRAIHFEMEKIDEAIRKTEVRTL